MTSRTRMRLSRSAALAIVAACWPLVSCKSNCEDIGTCGAFPALPYCDGLWRMRADGELCGDCPKRDEQDGVWYFPETGKVWKVEPGREFFLPLEGDDEPSDPRSCGTVEDGCGEKCPEMGPGGTGGGGGSSTTATTATGGNGGSSGSTSSSGGTSTTGSSGAAGEGGGGSGGITGGSGGTGGSEPVPCDGACDGAKPVCDPATDTCVECLDSTPHCGVPRPVCEPDSHECVECVENGDCDTGVCDPETHVCVECLENENCEAPTLLCSDQHFCVECLETNDCAESTASWCDDNTCAPCQTNDQCAHLPNSPVCDVGSGECVECTGTDYASCGVNEDDEPLVCDSLTRTCTDQVEHGGGTCQPCISDTHCPLGQLCVMQVFDDLEVGYFCFWHEGDTDNGAPETCSSASRPYVEQVPNVTSIDQQVANICGLRSSTCVARNQFSTKDCGTIVPDDSLCGVAPPEDAVCAAFGATEHFCTMTCLNDFDCPLGSPCNTTPLVPHCEL